MKELKALKDLEHKITRAATLVRLQKEDMLLRTAKDLYVKINNTPNGGVMFNCPEEDPAFKQQLSEAKELLKAFGPGMLGELTLLKDV